MCARSPLSKSVPCSEAIRRCGGKNKLAMVEAQLSHIESWSGKGAWTTRSENCWKNGRNKKKASWPDKMVFPSNQLMAGSQQEVLCDTWAEIGKRHERQQRSRILLTAPMRAMNAKKITKVVSICSGERSPAKVQLVWANLNIPRNWDVVTLISARSSGTVTRRSLWSGAVRVDGSFFSGGQGRKNILTGNRHSIRTTKFFCNMTDRVEGNEDKLASSVEC